MEAPEIKHSRHFIWASVDNEMLCLVERYQGIKTYYREGYKVSLWDLDKGFEVCEPLITTSALLAGTEVWRRTDGGEGTGFLPDLLAEEGR